MIQKFHSYTCAEKRSENKPLDKNCYINVHSNIIHNIQNRNNLNVHQLMT